MDVVDRTAMDLCFGNRQAAKHADTMFFRKIGKIALFDQPDDVPIRPLNARDELLLVRLVPGRRLLWTIRMFMVFVVIMTMMVVIPMIMLVLMIMILVMLVFRVNVDCTGVHPEFDSRDAFALLALEMQVMVFECDLGQFPFEYRWRDSEIGQCPDKHVATDPGEAVHVENPHSSQ